MLKINDIFPAIIMDMKKLQSTAIRAGGRSAAKLMKEDIIKSIERGVSPIKGEGRFVGYSESYKKAIKEGRVSGKKLRPVNLTGTTKKLLKSIKTQITTFGFEIFFSTTVKRKSGGTNNLAEIHSFEGPGGKTSAIRQIVPDEDGEFKEKVKLRAKKHLAKVARQVINRNLRRSIKKKVIKIRTK